VISYKAAFDRRIPGNEPAAACAQEISGVENGIARGVAWAMRPSASTSIMPALSPSRISAKRNRLDLLEIDGLADEQRATDVRYDECMRRRISSSTMRSPRAGRR